MKQILNEQLFTNTPAGQQFHPCTVTELRDFISEHIPEARRNQTFIKVLEADDHGEFKSFDVHFSNNDVCAPSQSAEQPLVYLQLVDEHNSNECPAGILFNDLQAVITAEQGNWADWEMKVYVHNHQGQADYFRIAYENTSNTVFLVRQNNNLDWTESRDYIDRVCTVVQVFRNNRDLRKANIRQAIQAVRDDAIGYDRVPTETTADINDLLVLVSGAERQTLINDIHAQFADAADGQNDNNHADDVPANAGVVDDVTPDNPFQEPAAEPEPAADPEPAAEPEPAQAPAAQPEQPAVNAEGEDVNGIRFIGEFNAGGEVMNGDFAVLLSVKSLEDTKAEIRALPPDIAKAITKKPVKFKQIDAGRPTNETRRTKTKDGKIHVVPAGLYNQVYRSYQSFFVFDTAQNITWKQTKTTGKTERPMILNSTRHDRGLAITLWGHMLSQSGNMWVPEFYNVLNGLIRQGLCSVIWDPTRYVVDRSAPQTSSADGEAKDGENQVEKERRKRAFIESTIFQRLMTGIVNAGWSFKGWFRKSDGTEFIKATDRKRPFTERMAILLSKHYDDWQYQYSGRFLDTLRPLMQYEDLIPARENDKIELPDEDKEQLDKAMAEVQKKLGPSPIDVQITVPGHLPRYNFITGAVGERQGNGWPKDNRRYFAVLFPGLLEEKLFGEDAEKFLREMNVWSTVEAAFGAAKEAYPDIVLGVCMDNGLKAS